MSKAPAAGGAAKGAPPAQQGQGGGGEHKEVKKEVSGKKGHTPLPGGCFCWGCKAQATRFNFCQEHYDHFKFGLIKKTGEPVPDFEKKFEHFLAHKSKRSAQRVA